MITDLKIDKNASIVAWQYNGGEFKHSFDKLDQAMPDQNLSYIFVLSSANPLPQRLHILDHFGNEITEIAPPDGSTFYYLTSGERSEVLIVCTFFNKLEGWHDWHYSYDEKNKKILRRSPAY